MKDLRTYEKVGEIEQGMLLRDYIAIHCTLPIKEEYITWGNICETLKLSKNTPIEDWTKEHDLEYECIKRYEMADMMLKVREYDNN